MNERQQLIEQIRQQSIEKRAQALREAARNQANNAPIAAAGASSSGGGRPAVTPPVPGFIFRVDTLLGDGMPTFEIPTSGDYIYDYTATWTLVSDPSTTGAETGLTGDALITFPAGGIYDIRITGLFPAMQVGKFSPDPAKVTGIIQWGDNQWQSMNSMFNQCDNLSLYVALDQPDLSQVTDMQGMFQVATQFNGDISGWDVSGVTNMNSMFSSASAFNADLSGWDVSSVTDMGSMFENAAAFNQDISGWDVSGVTDMSSMFSSASSFNQDISGWDVSSVTDMDKMFSNATSFNRDLSGWCVSGISPQPPGFDSGATAWILARPNWGSPCPP